MTAIATTTVTKRLDLYGSTLLAFKMMNSDVGQDNDQRTWTCWGTWWQRSLGTWSHWRTGLLLCTCSAPSSPWLRWWCWRTMTTPLWELVCTTALELASSAFCIPSRSNVPRKPWSKHSRTPSCSHSAAKVVKSTITTLSRQIIGSDLHCHSAFSVGDCGAEFPRLNNKSDNRTDVQAHSEGWVLCCVLGHL